MEHLHLKENQVCCPRHSTPIHRGPVKVLVLNITDNTTPRTIYTKLTTIIEEWAKILNFVLYPAARGYMALVTVADCQDAAALLGNSQGAKLGGTALQFLLADSYDLQHLPDPVSMAPTDSSVVSSPDGGVEALLKTVESIQLSDENNCDKLECLLEEQGPQGPSKIHITVPALTKTVLHMLLANEGKMPLKSVADTLQQQNVDKTAGLPIEYLLTWIPGVKIEREGEVKFVKWMTPGEEEAMEEAPGQIAQEMLQLLELAPDCTIKVKELPDQYETLFGRPVPIKWEDLMSTLKATPHIFQLVDCEDETLLLIGKERQVQRFHGEVLHLLKCRGGPVALHEVEQMFLKCRGFPLKPTEYGLCTLHDLLAHMPTCCVIISPPMEMGYTHHAGAKLEVAEGSSLQLPRRSERARREPARYTPDKSKSSPRHS